MILALEYKQQLNKRIEVFETKYLPLFLSLFSYSRWNRLWSMEIYKEIFGFGWISSEVCNFSNVGSYNAWIKRLA